MHSTESHRKRRHSGRSKSQTSRSHRKYKDDESGPAIQLQPVERPATIEDLRTARLTYIETPVAERERKMKYEYVKAVPVKVKVSDSRSARTSSIASRSKSASRVSNRKRRTSKNEESRATESAQEDHYVYRNERPSAQRTDTHQPARAGNATRTMNRESTNERIQHPNVVRRHTMPSERDDLRERPDTIPSSKSRPQLRKSTTTAPETLRPTLTRNSASGRAKTEISTVRSTITETKKSTGVLGSLFTAKPPPPEKKVSCLTCGDDVSVSKTAKLPCAHRMCHSCLRRIFKLSVNDPAHMPPRCCTDRHIDLKHVDSLFNDDFKKNWNRKYKEYKVKNRIYCPQRGCGQWIQPKHFFIDKGRKVGKCAACNNYVCAICSQKMHRSRDCPKDPAAKAFAEVAKQQGWQKCHRCSATVELKEGCNHMTCRCGAEFCMVCGLKWKSCDCPWFSYSQVDVLGDPIRFQEEMDRRRDQERRDEELARRIEVLEVDDDNIFNLIGMRNRAGQHMNANFIQQAREALTANYQQADQVARGLLNGLFVARENEAAVPEDAVTMTPAGIPVVRHRTRRRSTLQDLFDDQAQTDEQQEQARRIRNWANDLPN